MERRRHGCRRRAYMDVFTAFPELSPFKAPKALSYKQLLFIVARFHTATNGKKKQGAR